MGDKIESRRRLQGCFYPASATSLYIFPVVVCIRSAPREFMILPILFIVMPRMAAGYRFSRILNKHTAE